MSKQQDRPIIITVQVLNSLFVSVLSYTKCEIKFSLFSINNTHKKVPDSNFLLFNTQNTPKNSSQQNRNFLFFRYVTQKEKNCERKSRERQEEKEREEIGCVCTSLFGKYTILCFPHLSIHTIHALLYFTIM